MTMRHDLERDRRVHSLFTRAFIVDGCNVAVYVIRAIGSTRSRRRQAARAKSDAVVAAVGLCAAAIALSLTKGSKGHHILLRDCEPQTVVVLGLLINTIGCLAVRHRFSPDVLGSWWTMWLLVGGNSISGIYLHILHHHRDAPH